MYQSQTEEEIKLEWVNNLSPTQVFSFFPPLKPHLTEGPHQIGVKDHLAAVPSHIQRAL